MLRSNGRQFGRNHIRRRQTVKSKNHGILLGGSVMLIFDTIYIASGQAAEGKDGIKQ